MQSCILYELRDFCGYKNRLHVLVFIAKISLSAGQNWLPIHSMPTFPKNQDYFGRLTLNGLLLLHKQAGMQGSLFDVPLVSGATVKTKFYL